MNPRHARVLTIVAAGVILLAGSSLGSYAANGGPLLVGKSNKASKTTKLKTSKGPALNLRSKPGTAPLAVSNETVVGHLNSDLVDGLDGAALRNRTYVFTLSGSYTTTDTAFDLPGLPAGKYLASFAVGADFTVPVDGFGCFFTDGHVSTFTVASVYQNGTTKAWASATGYVDTTAGPVKLVCEKTGGGTHDHPSGAGATPRRPGDPDPDRRRHVGRDDAGRAVHDRALTSDTPFEQMFDSRARSGLRFAPWLITAAPRAALSPSSPTGLQTRPG